MLGAQPAGNLRSRCGRQAIPVLGDHLELIGSVSCVWVFPVLADLVVLLAAGRRVSRRAVGDMTVAELNRVVS